MLRSTPITSAPIWPPILRIFKDIIGSLVNSSSKKIRGVYVPDAAGASFPTLR